MSDPELSSSSLLNCFASEPDPIAWSFVLQTLIPVSNIKDLAKEVPKSNISDLESILNDAKLLATFLKGNTTSGSPEPTNDCRSNNIELFDDYTEDEIELLKVVSTCLVPGNSEGPVTEKGNAVLQEGPHLCEKGDVALSGGPSLTEKKDNISQEGPLVPGNDNSIVQDVHFVPANNNDSSQKTPPVTENDDEIMQERCDENSNEKGNNKGLVAEKVNAVLQEVPSLTDKGDAVLQGPSLTEKEDDILQESPLVPGNDNFNAPDVHLVPTNSNDILQKAPPVNKNDNEIMQESCPVGENSNEIMQKGCPIDDNGNPNMSKGHPVMENSVQIMPEGHQMSENCAANMPKAHPVTENGDEGTPEHHLITEKGDTIMQGSPATGNVNKKLQGPQALENDSDRLSNKYCLKCHRGGSLIMCEVENCSTHFHERCVVYLERNEMGTFKCPLCFYKHTAMAYHKAKERYSQAKKSLAIFLLKDTVDNRFDKRKSSKLNDDMNASGSNRKRRKRTEIQVKVEAVETEMHRNGSEVNSVQQQVIEDNTVNLNRGKIKAEVDAVSLINGTHDRGEISKIQSKETPQEVLNMPVQRVRAGTIHNEIGTSPRISM